MLQVRYHNFSSLVGLLQVQYLYSRYGYHNLMIIIVLSFVCAYMYVGVLPKISIPAPWIKNFEFPNPVGSRFILPGWIRICIRNPDPESEIEL